MKLKALAASICLMASAQMAQAALVDFYGVGAPAPSSAAATAETNFKGALSTNTRAVDTLEDPNGDRGWGPAPGTGSGSAIPLIFDSVSSPGTSVNTGSTFGGTSQVTSTASGGRSAHSGDFYWDGQNFSITFGAAVSAFGFWGSDIGDFDCQASTNCAGSGRGLTVQLYGVNDTDSSKLDKLLGTYTITGSTDNASELFWGFVDTGGARTRKIVFSNNSGGIDAQGFDDFMIGAVDPNFVPPRDPPNGTPEPGVLALVGLALAGAARARRRR